MPCAEIETVSGLTREDFDSYFVAKDRPVIVRGATNDWIATQRWSPAYLAAAGNDLTVEVRSKSDYGDSGSKRHFEGSQHLSLGEVAQMMTVEDAPDLSYARQDVGWTRNPRLLEAVWPLPFWPSSIAKEDGNLWVGPKGTMAQLHWDPGHNLFAQIFGEKRWVLVSPAESHLTNPNKFNVVESLAKYADAEFCARVSAKADRAHNVEEFVADLNQSEQAQIYQFLASVNNCDVDVESVDGEPNDAFATATRLEGTLSAGDMIFVPRCWRHYVRSLSPSISINWFFPSERPRTPALSVRRTLLEHLTL